MSELPEANMERLLVQGYKAPHWHSREVLAHISWTTALALIPVVVASTCLFGLGSLANLAVALTVTALCEWTIRTLANRNVNLRNGQSLVMAILLTLTLPPTAGFYLVGVAAVLVVIFKELVGGFGHYLWHPVLLARVTLVAIMPLGIVPTNWPVLKKESVIVGQLTPAEMSPTNASWLHRESAGDPDAWTGPRPVNILARAYQPLPTAQEGNSEALHILIRDRLPPVKDCLLGTTGGGLGETCILATLLGGLFLLQRGYVRWTLPAGALLGALAVAAVFPVGGGAGGGLWWPLLVLIPGQPSLPAGLVMVFYHLVVGELLFAIFFIASDMTSSPLRNIGHLWFGVGIGALTVILRTVGLVPGDTYWAILIMNTFVPLIDRLTRRRVYGT